MSMKVVNISRRQDLGGILGGVNSIVSDAGSGIGSVVSQAGSGLTSGLGSVTGILQTSTTTTPTSTPPSTTQTSISSTSGTSLSLSSPTSSTSLSSTTSSALTSSTPTTTSSSISTSETSSESPTVFVSTSDGVQHTITSFVTSTPSSSPTSTSSSNSSKGFLNNKPLEGFVFALCGIVALVIIFLIATFALRRSKRKKMINEALSYEPTTTHGYNDDMEHGLVEKTRNSFGSTRSGTNPTAPFGGYTGGSGMPPVQTGYGYEHEYPSYAPRSQNPAYDVNRAYGPNSHVGGAAFDLNQTVPMNRYIPPSQAQTYSIPRVPVRTLTPEATPGAAR